MKKWIGIIVGGLAVCAGFAVIVVLLWYHHTVSASQPQTAGSRAVAGLLRPVEIIRDRFGVAHITAENERDLYYAMGFAMAQDRLWQMEFMRRLGQGRLAEVLGKELIDVDRFFRVLSAGGPPRTVNGGFAFIPIAFAEGINAYLADRKGDLPLEFELLGFHPEPWRPEDYFMILNVMNWGLSIGWKVDLTASRMLDKVGPEKLRAAFPDYPQDAAPIITEPIPADADLAAVSDTIRKAARIAAPWGFAASNNWVIGGERSVTGKPLLANDTHLELTNPSAWWEVHLTCPSLNAAGFAVPGLPGVAVGRNLSVAWGITSVMVDDVDFYMEQINPENPRQYRYGKSWKTLQARKEIIRVKNGQPLEFDILLTHRGPIFPDFGGRRSGQALSVRWAGREVTQTAAGAHLLCRAQGLADVIEALRAWHLPSQNIVFADTRGNIGYWCCATLPIRKQSFGLLPVPGWTDAYEWNGWVPFDQRPHLLNPPRGVIATANNQVQPSENPPYIGNYWEPSDRATRIHQMLDTKEKLSMADCRRMQADVTCLLAEELTPRLVAAVNKRLSEKSAPRAAELLTRWDHRMDKDSPAAAIYETTYHKLLGNIFQDELGPSLFEDYLNTVIFPPRALRHILRAGASPWLDDVRTEAVENLDDMLVRSLDQALRELGRDLGADPDGWRWGRLHTLTFGHALDKKKPLDRIFNLPAGEAGGNHLTVNMGLYRYTDPYRMVHGPSQRMLVDLADPATAWHVLPTGQSGLVGNPHYDDQIELYLDGAYHPSWLLPADVGQNLESRLTLIPKDAAAAKKHGGRPIGSPPR
jgi:penicillin amidase